MNNKKGLGLLLVGAGFYLMPFGTDILQKYFIDHGATFVEATWNVYLICFIMIIVGYYLVSNNVEGFVKKLTK